MSPESLRRYLPILAPSLGLLVLWGLTLAFKSPASSDRDQEAFIRATLFEIKSMYALSPKDEAFTRVRPDIAAALAKVAKSQELGPEARRFMTLALLILEAPDAARGLLPEDDPSAAFFASLAAGERPEDPTHRPDMAVPDPWLLARLDLLLASTVADTDVASMNQVKDRVFSTEQRFVERLSSLVALGFLLLVLGILFWFRWRGMMRTAQGLQLKAHIARPARLDGRTALQIGLGWFALHVGLSLVLPPLLRPLAGGEAGSSWALILTYTIDALIGLAFLHRFAFGGGHFIAPLKEYIWPAHGMERTTVTWIFGGLGGALVLVMGASFLQGLLPSDELFDNPGVRALFKLDSDEERMAMLANVVILAPLFEEILFRGFVYHQLRLRLGTGAAISVSATLFAFVHLSLGSFLPIFALGVVLALAYEASGNLLTSMAIHGAWNAMVTISVMRVLL